MEFDILIVGAGFFGATMARRLTDAGKKCLVIDKNDLVGGMASDAIMDSQLVCQHGAHILHTNNDEVWNFLNQFSTIDPFTNKPKVLSGNQVFSFPINMMTLHQMWGVVTPRQAYEKLESVRIKCQYPNNFEEWALDKIGTELYEKFIYGYTKKQWMREPRELPASIIQRLPIRLTYDENYFAAKHQGMPREGYTRMVENMLDGIRVELGVDLFSMNWDCTAKHLIYSGPVDKFFDYEFGHLEYNTLRFVHEMHKTDYQGNAVFNHVDLETPYLRSVEHKHFYIQDAKHKPLTLEKGNSIVTFDYPVPFKDHPEPYYPIRDIRNRELYHKYHTLKKELPNVTFGGRLGSYQYCDIDQTVASAITQADKLLEK